MITDGKWSQWSWQCKTEKLIHVCMTFWLHATLRRIKSTKGRLSLLYIRSCKGMQFLSIQYFCRSVCVHFRCNINGQSYCHCHSTLLLISGQVSYLCQWFISFSFLFIMSDQFHFLLSTSLLFRSDKKSKKAAKVTCPTLEPLISVYSSPVVRGKCPY